MRLSLLPKTNVLMIFDSFDRHLEGGFTSGECSMSAVKVHYVSSENTSKIVSVSVLNGRPDKHLDKVNPE